MSGVIMVAEGATSQVKLYENKIRITNEWWLSQLLPFYEEPSKTIPIDAISGIKLKKATMLSGGHIKFGEGGHEESGDGLFELTEDDNTVQFRKSQMGKFEELQGEINKLRNKQQQSNGKNSEKHESAIETLRQRYAEGELSKEEYEERLAVLEEQGEN